MSSNDNVRQQVVGRPKKVSRQQIVSAALAVMEKDGFASLSLRALARELGINHATLYNYIENIEEVEREALDALRMRIPMPDRTRPEPVRQQLIEHLLAVHKTQGLYPKFCFAPPGTPTWRIHMTALASVLDSCSESEEQIEDITIAYNTLISLVARNAERSRVTGNEAPVATDLKILETLPDNEFQMMIRPHLRPGGASKKLTSFVFRLDYLISNLMPGVAAVDTSILQALEQEFGR